MYTWVPALFHIDPGGASTPRRSLSRLFAILALIALCAFAASASAQSNGHRILSSSHDGGLDAGPIHVPPRPQMVPLMAAMTQAYPVIGVNADGTNLWPCYGRSPVANVDCPETGNPALPLPRGAMVHGRPAFSWALDNNDILGFGIGNGVGCDAFINGTTGPAGAQYRPCGQVTTFFEDDTNDANDDLLNRIVVTQGLNIIFDSGTVDYGPAGPAVKYPVDVELIYDANFGFWPGAGSGHNNGNCSPDIGYPLTAPTFPGVPYQLAAGNHCDRPQPGKARVHTQTILATPTYTQVDGVKCTKHGVTSPCFTVSWEQKYQIEQDWDIFFW
jgi:hypothetical protein